MQKLRATFLWYGVLFVKKGRFPMSEVFYEAMKRGDIMQEPVKYKKEHLDDFEKSGLKEETLRKAEYRSESGGWTVPYQNPVTGEEYYRRKKLDKPIQDKEDKKKEIRYLTPKEKKPHIYFSKQLDWDEIFESGESTVLTEGEKKADKYIQDTGKPAIAVSGVWCWSSGGEPTEDLKFLCKKFKVIEVAFDSDYKNKPQVQKAKEALIKAIEGFGAIAIDCSLPGPEKGLDDFLVVRGTDELLKHFGACTRLKAKERDYAKAVEEAAVKMLKNPNLMEEIIDDVHFLGAVGEDSLIKKIYLSFISYRLDSCVGFILRGESSSGKTFLVNTIANLMPDGVVERVTGHSAQALNYWTDIAHKIIIIGEARPPKDEFWEVDSAWRQLIEDNQIVRKVTRWNEKKKHYELEDVTVKGPIVYGCTTTIPNLHPENENRLLIFATNESPSHVKNILEYQRQQAKKNPEEVKLESENKKFIIAKHKKSIELLKAVPLDSIQIPYAEQLYFDNFSNVASRDQKKLLKLVRIIAYLYQYQRNSSVNPISESIPGQQTQLNQGLSDNRLNWTEVDPPIATVEDYRIVYETFKDYFDSNAEQIPESLIQKWELAYEAFGEEKSFTATDVMKVWKRKTTQTYTTLKNMAELKMIKKVEDGKGRDETPYKIIAFNSPGARLTKPEDIITDNPEVSFSPTEPTDRQQPQAVDLPDRQLIQQQSDNSVTHNTNDTNSINLEM